MKQIDKFSNVLYEQVIQSIQLGVFEHLHMACALLSKEGSFIYCNKAFMTMYNLKPDVTSININDSLIIGKLDITSCLKNHKVVVTFSQSHSESYGIAMSYPVYDSAHELKGAFVEIIPMGTDKTALSTLVESMRHVEMKTYSSSPPKAPRKGNGLLTFESIVGNSPSMRNLRRLGYMLANSHEPILIYGESGTGKEMVAQAIHMASPRADGPFICVNCAALPRNLMESELFGYASGSFTGARTGGMKGKFEEADNGTIFLDEISEMPLSVQAKLLRVLESGEIQKIGHKGQLRSNFRILAATNRNLLEMVHQGRFREDLYHRLNVFELNIPPLREREGDIFILIRFFMDTYLGVERSKHVQLDDNLVRMLTSYPWTGNVRELKNTMVYALFLLEEDENVLGPKHFPHRFLQHYSTPGTSGAELSSGSAPMQKKKGLRKDVFNEERQKLQNALLMHQYNKVLVAKKLGISRSKLYRDLRRYGLITHNKEDKKEE